MEELEDEESELTVVLLFEEEAVKARRRRDLNAIVRLVFVQFVLMSLFEVQERTFRNQST